VLLLPVSN